MAAASSIRSLLHALPRIHTQNNNIINHSSSLLSFSTTNLFESKTLNLKTTLKPFSSHVNSRILSFSSFAAYAETDEHNYEEEEGGEIEFGKSRAVSSPAEKAVRLYVGNLPYSMTSSELEELFGQAGTIETAEIVYDRVTNRSRGFAFVTMANRDDAKEAIRMFDGAQVGGRTVKVNFPDVPLGGELEVMGPRARASSRGYVDSPYKIFAGNLAWSVTSESLKDVFSHLPGLLGAKVIYEYDSGRSRGFGFVSFASAEDVQFAIETMNGKEVEGRPLRLNLALERSSTSAATL